MQALIIYDSIHGSTKRVALAIADGLRGRSDVRVLAAETVVPTDFDGVDLLIVGCPTLHHGVSHALRDLFERVSPSVAHGKTVAAFDTRHHVSRFLGGSAAHIIERELRTEGGYPLLPAASFFVADQWGPVEDGEIEHATRWGRDLYQAYLFHAGAVTATA